MNAGNHTHPDRLRAHAVGVFGSVYKATLSQILTETGMFLAYKFSA